MNRPKMEELALENLRLTIAISHYREILEKLLAERKINAAEYYSLL